MSYPELPESCTGEQETFHRIYVTGPIEQHYAAMTAMHGAGYYLTRSGPKGDGTSTFLHIGEKRIDLCSTQS
jgi:hypothetical protein